MYDSKGRLWTLFNTSNIEIIKTCQCYFSFELSNVIIPKRVHKFIRKFE